MLDGAMEQLGQKDHDAVVLRFFENRNFREVGAALGASEDAAKMRVSRALEKLRKFFTKRGVSSTTDAIAGAISANSIQVAPMTLAKSATALAMVKGAAASGSTLALINGALKLMFWANVKAATAVGGGTIMVVALTALLIHGLPSSASLHSAARFGPVQEISLDNTGKATFLDLDTAGVLPDYKGAPADFENWKKANGVDIALPKLVTGKDGVRRLELNGVDAPLPEVAAPKDGIYGFELKYGRLHNSIWNEMSAAETLQQLSMIGPGIESPTGDYVLSGTYLFKTREGGAGIMQINLYTAYPRTMKIRYKLVQPSN